MRRRSDLLQYVNGAVIVLVLLVTAVVTYRNTRQIWQDAGWVAHTHEVLDALEGLLLSATDAETGQRGFLITGDPAYLQPYESALATIARQEKDFERLTADNPSQQARVPELRRRLDDKLALLAETVATFREQGRESARTMVLSGRGKVAMDALREQVRSMKGEEERLLAERSERAAGSYRSAVVAAFATTGVGLVLLVVLMVLSARNARARAAAATQLFAQKELLRTTLASIGDAVITTDVDGRVTFVNAVAAELTGWTHEDAVGRELRDVFAIVNESTRQPVDNPALRALREGQIVGLANHTILLSRDGRERPIDDSAAPIRNEADEVMGAVLVFRDVAEQRQAHLALQRSEARKAAILDAALDGIVTIDQESRIIEFNPAAERIFGIGREAAVGRSLPDLLIPQGQRAAHRNGMVRSIASGGGPILGRRVELTAMRADGTEFPVEVSIAALEHDGSPIFTAHLRDITERKATEAAMAERLRLLELGAAIAGALTRRDTLAESLQHCAQALVRHLDAALARIWTLDEASQMLRLEASAGLSTELDGPYGKVAVGEREIGRIAQERTAFWSNAVRGDAGVPEQDWVEREGLVSFAGSPLEIEGRVVGVMAMYARRALSETTRNSFAAAARQIAVGIQRGRAEETVGRLLERERTRAERLGQVAAASSTINSAMTQASVAGVVRIESKRILAAEAAELFLDGTSPPDRSGGLQAPLVGRGGRAIGTLHLTRSRPPFEAEDQSILLQLAHMTAVAFENARLYEELRDGDRRKDEFIATLAHELRNPLAPIRNALRILRLAGVDRVAAEQGRAMIERQVDQVVRLVDDLLDVSRISRGKLQLRLERVELATVLEAALETSRPLIEDARHELHIDLPAEPLWIEGDPTRLAQVFLNLLNNAAKYTQDHGRIWLRAERAGGEVSVEVRDSGIGIPAEKLSRVFEMFMQVEDRSLQRTEGGLGIGLTLVKELVEMHGGSVTAESQGPGLGSAFTVKLPLAPDAGQKDAADAASTGEDAGSALDRKRRILVVDDNRDAVESLAMLLEMMGYEVRTAEDGLEAVDVAQAFAPDVVLLDIGLPRLNGYESAQRIRQLEGGRDVFLVALTGWGQEEDRRRSREAGFDHHLVKPVDPDALEELLRRHARGGRGDGAA